MHFTSTPKIQTKVIEERYEVRSDGRIFSLRFGNKPISKPRELHGCRSADGHVYLILKSKYGAYKEKLSKLIAEHFLPKVEGKNFVKHIDGNKYNNHVDNLEWVERMELVDDYEDYVEKKRHSVYIISQNGYPIHIMNNYKEITEKYFVGANAINKSISNNKLLIKLYHVWKLPKGDERIADVRKLLDRCEEERQQRILQGVQRIAPRIMHK